MKKLRSRDYVYVLVLLLLIGGYAGLLLIWHHQRSEVVHFNGEVGTVQANETGGHGTTYNAAALVPSDKAVYLPLAKLKLPLSALTEKLIYNYTGPYSIPGDRKAFPAQLELSTYTQAANDKSTTNQFDCTEIAYAEFATPSYPMNPMWKSDGSLRLADGRTMHVYYASSIPGCQASWAQNGVNAKAIADTLKRAVSY